MCFLTWPRVGRFVCLGAGGWAGRVSEPGRGWVADCLLVRAGRRDEGGHREFAWWGLWVGGSVGARGPCGFWRWRGCGGRLWVGGSVGGGAVDCLLLADARVAVGVVCVSCWTGTAGKVEACVPDGAWQARRASGPALRSARAPPAFCLPLAAPPPSPCSKPPPLFLAPLPFGAPPPSPCSVPPPFVPGTRALPSPGQRDAVHCSLFFPEQRMPAAVLRRVRGAQCDWHWRCLPILVV
jgi:hypothetical protein